MADWITTLDRLNTVLCRPAGRPIWMICSMAFLWKPRCRRSRCMAPSSLTSSTVTIMADTVWLRMVASATPATLIWNTMTNSRFSTTLMTPATARQTSGRRVSPTARSREALKLYSMVIGIPMK